MQTRNNSSGDKSVPQTRANWRKISIRVAATASLTATLLISGCSTFTSDSKSSKKDDSKWWKFGKKKYQEPRTMAVLWSEDTLIVPGKPITRGFGGRIYFYNDRSQAVSVDGELSVYGFDDSMRGNVDVPPEHADKRFKFTAEQFTTHFSQSELGASYSIWIPWDIEGGPQKEITLIPTFVTKSGKIVRGDSSKVTLSGKKAVTNMPSGVGSGPAMPVPTLPAPMQPMLGEYFPYNQVQTASAEIPSNVPGQDSIATSSYQNFGNPMQAGSFNGEKKSDREPLKTTTIQVPRTSSLKR